MEKIPIVVLVLLLLLIIFLSLNYFYPSPTFLSSKTAAINNVNSSSCAGNRYGCCPNNRTAKQDEMGSNCLLTLPSTKI